MEPTIHWTHTRDGVHVALYNYRPARLEPHRFPVLLCHGLGSNRANLDYPDDERQSLAKHLCRCGHDAWVVELRGAGRSSKPRFIFGKLRFDWVLDDYYDHDLPAAVARILEITGRPALHWVGHSMGGMLAYPFLVSADPGLVRSCVTVGSPIIARVKSKVHDYGLALIWILDYVPLVASGLGGRLLSPVAKYVRRAVEAELGSFFYNPANMTDETIACLLARGVENLPCSLVQQMSQAYREKHYRSYYGTSSIRDNLHRIETPLLVVAGSADGLTPPDDLRYVYEHVSSHDKQFVVIGRETGASADYGHVDLILGKNAPCGVFPLIESWIDRHDRPPLAPALRVTALAAASLNGKTPPPRTEGAALGAS